MVFALVLVVSGIGLFSFANGKQVPPKNADAPVTAAAVNATSTAVVNATTLPANATARVSWLQNTYDNVTNGTPTLDDPLRDNSKGYSWDEGADSYGGKCAFAGGVYHVRQSDTNYFHSCA